MELGWMRIEGPQTSHLTWAELCEAVVQSEALGLRQFHTPQLKMSQIQRLPRTQSLRIGLCAKELGTQPPRITMHKLREIMNDLNDRLVLTFPIRSSSEARTAGEVLETMILNDAGEDAKSGFPMDPPHPEILSIPQVGCHISMRSAAGSGFHALSPAWQSQRDLAHDWRDIVIGATHAARRAKPRQWHVARYIYVTDDPDQLETYCNRIADLHEQHGFSSRSDSLTEIIAGSAETVALELRNLRKTAGPFGVLQCVDPGLDAEEAHEQRHRLMKDVLPALVDQDNTLEKVLENT